MVKRTKTKQLNEDEEKETISTNYHFLSIKPIPEQPPVLSPSVVVLYP